MTALTCSGFDWDVAGRTVYGEARGESKEGLTAVAWVIRNRVERPGWWGSTVSEVCQKKLQFSCWNHDDPNREIILKVKSDDGTFRRILGITALVLSGDTPDPTKGATHYFTVARPAWALVWPPEWSHKLIQTALIGAHIFFREPLPDEQA